MKKVFGFILLLLTCTCTMAQKSKIPAQGTQITIGKNATNIAQITNDAVVVITGNTYRYTVDTPEDRGLVSTKIDIKQLPLQLASADGSIQKYTVTDKNGMTKSEGELLDGDQLVVTAQDGSTTKGYHILVKPMALSGRLALSQSSFTVNTNHTLTLYFTAGQRSPDAGVTLFLPNGINATMDNTTVNVIGRGDVKLSGLTTQSIGRVGTKYSYSKVGDVTKNYQVQVQVQKQPS